MMTKYGVAKHLKGVRCPELGDTIIWNGKNTEDVVRFCYYYYRDLCPCYNTFTNLVTGKQTLSVEPGDIMRKSCFYIELGQTVIASKSNDGITDIVKILDVGGTE